MSKNSETLIENYVDYLVDEKQTIFLTESKLSKLADLPKKLVDSKFKFGVKIVSAIVAGTGLGVIGGMIAGIIKSGRTEGFVHIINAVGRKISGGEGVIPTVVSGAKAFFKLFSQHAARLDPNFVKAGLAAGLLMSLMMIYSMIKTKNKKLAAKKVVDDVKAAGKNASPEVKEVLDKAAEDFEKSF